MRTRLLLGLLSIALTTPVVRPVVRLSAQEAPLPDPGAFLAAIRARMIESYRTESQMAYTERGSDVQLNPIGRMGEGPQLLAEVYPHPVRSLSYRRILEREGRPVPPAEIAEQDRRQLEKIASWNLRPEAERRATPSRRDMQQEVLNLFDYKIDARVTLDGASAIIVTFEPKPDTNPTTREGRVASSFAGRAWVHEHDLELMRVEAKAVKDVSFGWGVIGRLHRGSHVESTRRKIGGVWQTTGTQFTGSVRALVVRTATLRMRREYFNYRPYDPSQLAALLAKPQH